MKICLTMRIFLNLWYFPLHLMQGWNCRGEIRSKSLRGVDRLKLLIAITPLGSVSIIKKNPWQRKITELGKWLHVNQRELFFHRRHWLLWTPLLIQAMVIIRETFGIMAINLLHSNISMHILLKVLYTFPIMLTGRICLTIKSLFSWWSFPLFSWCRRVIQGWSCDSHA